MKRAIAAALAGLILASAMAAAAGEEQRGGVTFVTLDTDGNRRIDAREAQAYPLVAEHFADADTNRDGALDIPEFYRMAIDIRDAEHEEAE